MNLKLFRTSKIEALILNVVNAYEARFQQSLPTMERLITGAIRKRMWFHAISVLVSLSPHNISNRLEPYLISKSRRDLTGAALTSEAWMTFQKLSAIDDLSKRDIRVAAMRGFVDRQGNIDILMSLVRSLAVLASGSIATITAIFVISLIALWSGFVWSPHTIVIVFQFTFFTALSIVIALFCIAICYGIFVYGVLPLSIAYKFKQLEREFLNNGVIYQIHE